jgi:hypothetical protein
MGGIGSGSRPQRRVVEDCLILEADVLAKLGCFQVGLLTQKEISWKIDGVTTATAKLEVDLRCERHQPQLHLTLSQSNQEDFTQIIALRDITPTFGGIRWFFKARGGGKRCQKLYLPPRARRFATREEYQLTYRSKQMAHADRIRVRAHRLRESLPGAPFNQYPPRPRGMHRKTYNEIVCRLQESDAKVQDQWRAYLWKWAESRQIRVLSFSGSMI